MKPEKRLLKHYKYIQKVVRHEAYCYYFDYDDVMHYVLHHLANDDYKKVRAFDEEGDACFKTFITTVVVHLIISFDRQTKSHKKRLEKFGRSLLIQGILEPDKFLIEMEEIQFKEKALGILPGILKTLTDDEQRIIKMKYYKGLKISTISRELKISWYKIRKMFEDAREKLKRGLDEALKKNQEHGD